AGPIAEIHTPRSGRHTQRAARAIGRHIGGRDRHTDHALDVGYECLADAKVERDVLAGGDGHVQIGVRLQTIARTTRDADLAALAIMEPPVPAAFIPTVV